MSPPRFYLPETVERMTAVYKRVVQELKIEHASTIERERLARCVLSIGNTYANPHRLHDQSVRLYLRHPTMSHRSRLSINTVRGLFPITRSDKSSGVTIKGAVSENELDVPSPRSGHARYHLIVLRSSGQS
jgi:hypothetical protein